MSKGIFVTFEGGEGVGKTSVINELVKKFDEDGIAYLVTREPGGSKIAEDIRNVILDKNNTEMDPRTEALLYAASRRQHLVEKVLPALDEGKIVLSDRYIDSSLAYQGYARDIGIDEVLSVNLFATDGVMPDITFLFELDPEVGLQRIAVNSNREVNRLDLEKLPFHKKVYDGYQILKNRYPDRIIPIDASQSIQEECDEIYEILKERIG